MSVETEAFLRLRKALASGRAADPIDRINLPADGSDLATTQALANALKQLVINLGIAKETPAE